MNMTNVNATFSIETPTFKLVHKILNASSLPFNVESEENTLKLPGLLNLTNDKKLITLKVNQLNF
jgi:hypothetical protein